ncbi:hypothetical protein [Mycobacterium sp. GA-1199]|uniref:hypothetical protein n=1 Tax=Mycobacterium sp. GA-1199 TaxID=1772287 RepID=UPI0012E3E732|nr:hypothetical protein [Mycobacterium sp. GA-1199]
MVRQEHKIGNRRTIGSDQYQQSVGWLAMWNSIRSRWRERTGCVQSAGWRQSGDRKQRFERLALPALIGTVPANTYLSPLGAVTARHAPEGFECERRVFGCPFWS